MSRWFDRAFGAAGNAVAEVRHELLGAWFGRNFEPHPSRPPAFDPEEPSIGDCRADSNSGWFWVNFQPDRQTGIGPDVADPGERDIHGNELGVDR